MSADPLGMGAADLTNPQSLNQYSYVINNPMNLVDPTGMDFEDLGLGGGDFGGGFGGGGCDFCEQPPIPVLSPSLPGPFGGLPGTNSPFPTPGGGFNWQNWLFGPMCQAKFAGLPNPCIQDANGPLGSCTYTNGKGETVTNNQSTEAACNEDQGKFKAESEPGWCTALNHAGNTVVALGGVVFLWGTLADAGVVTAPAGVISQASGGIGMTVGGIAIGIADAGMALGICH